MKLGIVGLPNVGKSTLFNSLTKAGAESANYPFCTIDPNVGIVTVPDERLKLLGDFYHSKKVTPAVIEFVDIAGLVKGASKGEGLGNQFLANIREVDAIVHVVRCFEDENVVHVDGSIDPLRDIETINLELIFSDIEILDRRIAKTTKTARMDKEAAKELELLKKLKETLEEGKPVGIGCAMKNAGVGVGIPDWGRVKLIVEEDAKLHIYSGASCIGQGLGTVLVQMTVTNTDLKRDDIVYERSNTWIAPDSGTTSGSRQTMITGEACRRACEKLMEAKGSDKSLKDLIGQEFYGDYLAKTDPLGADVPNPVSHVAYGYATQVCILNEKTGKIDRMIAAQIGRASCRERV